MKTKFILHGGYTREDNESNKAFFAELVKDVPDGGIVLVVCFAKEDNEAEEKFHEDSKSISEAAGERAIKIVMASRANFMAEVKQADAIYIRGGDTRLLKRILGEYKDFRSAIAGKIVAGSSAGAYIASTYHFSSSQNQAFKGFGFIPARVICHFQSTRHPIAQDADPIAAMDKCNNDLELIILKDYEWVVREVELQ